MELSILRHPKLVIALDIGSTYSGYAWQSRTQFETNRNVIHFNTSWGSGGLQLHKTKTCLYVEIDQDKQKNKETDKTRSSFELDPATIKTVKIGHDAENTYMKIAKQNKTGDLMGRFYLFSRFKLMLYKCQKCLDELLFEDHLGQQIWLIDIMPLFIKALKDKCLEKLKMKNNGNPIDEKTTLFVVTVPAIWSDEARLFMRKAALKAGIGNKNILLALEPEAAAISCLHIAGEFGDGTAKFGDEGQRFLVVDLGGGTADLSAIEVEKSGMLRQLFEPTGILAGGQNINDAFFQVCHDSYEGETWKKIFSKATPTEMINMEADFEQKKVTIGTNDPDSEYIDIALPGPVKEGLKDGTIRIKDDAKLQFANDELAFDTSFVRKELFDTTCKHIYAGTIKKVLSKTEARGITTVILVGGFAESPIVVQDIRDMVTTEFSEVKEVIVPSSPFKSVLQGAVLYGHDPMIFSSRICRETYGVKTNRIFDETQHDESKKWENKEDGKFRCKDIFDIHVRKGQSVRLLDKQPECTYNPMYIGQKSLGLPIYASTSPNPKYTTDEGCREIGKITVDMPDTTGETKRTVEVTMIYGGTELSVIAKDVTTGKEFNADIKFNA